MGREASVAEALQKPAASSSFDRVSGTEGFAPYENVVEVGGKKELALTITLAPLSTTGELVVRSEPGSTVTVDERLVGSGEWRGNVVAGAHTVKVTAAGKHPQVRGATSEPRSGRCVPRSLCSRAARAYDAQVRVAVCLLPLLAAFGAGCSRPDPGLSAALPADPGILHGGPTVSWTAHGLTWQVPSGWTCVAERADFLCTAGSEPHVTARVRVESLQGTIEAALHADRFGGDDRTERHTLTVDGMQGTLVVDHISDKAEGFHCVSWTGYRPRPIERAEFSACTLGALQRDARRPVFEAMIGSLRNRP